MKPNNTTAIMLDIETLGTTPGSIIYQIAAVQFCPDTFTTGKQIELHICPTSSQTHGLTSDPATLQWHADKRHTPPLTTHDGALPLPEALDRLAAFTRAIHPHQFWCKGVSFDFPLLEAAYRAADMAKNIPWQYWQQYDMRTILNLAFPGKKHPPAAHTALADCHAQIKQLAAANDAIIHTCNQYRHDKEPDLNTAMQRIDASNVMLGVFAGCIKTGLYPKDGSDCQTRLSKIIKDNDCLLSPNAKPSSPA